MGDGLCIDLDPAPGGTVGQVIRRLHDDDRRERVAASFTQWFPGPVVATIGLEERNNSGKPRSFHAKARRNCPSFGAGVCIDRAG